VLDVQSGSWTMLEDQELPGGDYLCQTLWRGRVWVGTPRGLLELEPARERPVLRAVHLPEHAVQDLAPVELPRSGLGVATSAGLFILREDPDGGWVAEPEAKFSGRDVRAVWAPPARPQRTFVGTDQGLFFFSQRFGVWLETDMKIGRPVINAIHGTDNGALVLVACDLGLYLSQDGGLSFSHLARGIPAQHCSAVVVQGGRTYALFPEGLFRSGPRAYGWSPVPIPAELAATWSFLLDPNAESVYLGSDGHGLARVRLPAP